jgi:hypothetical protein
MTLYTFALFVHLVGVILGVGGVCAWLFALIGVRAASTVDQVRALLALYALAANVALGGVLLIVAGGLYLALSTTLWQSPWLVIATISFVLVLSLGGALLGRRIQALTKAAREAPAGPLPGPLVGLTHDPLMRVVLQTYIAILFGIVFLMATKPALSWSIISILLAAALGVLSGLPLMRTARLSSS